jgi:3-oxocholest-4-en-26-oate---CoA ligase
MMPDTGWNFASVWEAAADFAPEQVALLHDDDAITWGQWDRDAGALAAALRARGVRQGDKVAVALHNSPAALQSYYAVFKLGAVPVNTNYRYLPDELVYLWDNADAAAVIFDDSMADRVAGARAHLPGVKLWVCLGTGSASTTDWAVPFRALLAEGLPEAGDRRPRSGDDLFLLYTGGTTGKPKGVMWRQDDFFTALHRIPYSRAEARRLTESMTKPGRPVSLPAAPLMHGGGLVVAWGALDMGGRVVTSSARSLDADCLLDLIVRHRVTTLGIIGDAFAKPLVDAINAKRTPPDLSSLRLITSGGAMWSTANKKQLLVAAPRARLVDALGASEAINLARSVMSTDRGGTETAQFSLSDQARVLDDDGNDVIPGSGVAGRIALTGPTSLGYYKDPEASRAKFIVKDGTRLVLTGDYASVDADGTLRFLGRGNLCINTGGEKVFPEEVEEVLKARPGVRDAAVTSLPDERLGEAVCAVVDCEPGVTDADLIAAVKARLAGYKAPKVVLRHTVPRLANGKVDYPAVKAWAASAAARHAGAATGQATGQPDPAGADRRGGPLEGVVVLDLATLIAGPACARYFADFGATVVKIENPHRLDNLRKAAELDPRDDLALFFKLHNRGKLGTTIDLKSDEGREQLLKLVERADVVVENLRPGTLERLGLGPDVLFSVQPKLVLTRISAFGQTGPYASRPGFATLAEAMSGFAYLNGERGAPPLLPPVAVTDEVTALVAFAATLLALRGTGGQVVDVDLLQSMLSIMGPAIPAAALLGKDGERFGSGVSFSVPRGVWRTGDGKWVAISGSSNGVAVRIMDVIGLGDDPRFQTNTGRVANREEVDAAIAAWVGARSLAEVLRAMEAADAAAAAILAPTELVANEHVVARGNLIDVDSVPMQGRIARLSDGPSGPPEPFRGDYTVDQVCGILDETSAR